MKTPLAAPASVKERRITKVRKAFTLFSVMLVTLTWTPLSRGAGVTIVTHGYNSTVTNGWGPPMIDAVFSRMPLYNGHNSACLYQIYVTDSGGLQVTHGPRIGTDPLLTDTGEILVELDWSTIDDLIPVYSTSDIAAVVAVALRNESFISDLQGRALAELPIHFIGHSRGASLVCELARRLVCPCQIIEPLPTWLALPCFR